MIRTLYNENFTFVLLFLLIHTIAVPFIGGLADLSYVLNISFSAVLLSTVIAMGRGRNNLIRILLLALPCFVLLWFDMYLNSTEFQYAGAICQVAFSAYMVIVVIFFIFKRPVVTRNIISAALVVYLFMAVLWSNLYFLAELLYPGSFSIAHEVIINDKSVLDYFSIVTITTLGYGDIIPLTSQARSLASLEAFVGQIYLTVLVARLVGMHVSSTSRETSK